MDDIAKRLTNILFTKDKVREYLRCFQGALDDIEAAVADLKHKRWIRTAEGKQLDGCGQIVGEPRLGRDDETYRDAILYKVFVNISTATPVDINKAINLLTLSSQNHYWESYPACYVILGTGPDSPDNISGLMRDITAAGIGESSVHLSYTEPAFFLSGPGERPVLWVANKKLKVNGKNLLIDKDTAMDNGSYLGGIAMPFLSVNSKTLTVNGKRLRINVFNRQTVIDSGAHLPGAFEV